MGPEPSSAGSPVRSASTAVPRNSVSASAIPSGPARGEGRASQHRSTREGCCECPGGNHRDLEDRANDRPEHAEPDGQREPGGRFGRVTAGLDRPKRPRRWPAAATVPAAHSKLATEIACANGDGSSGAFSSDPEVIGRQLALCRTDSMARSGPKAITRSPGRGATS